MKPDDIVAVALDDDDPVEELLGAPPELDELVAVELNVKPDDIVAVALDDDEPDAELLGAPPELGELELVDELVAVELKV